MDVPADIWLVVVMVDCIMGQIEELQACQGGKMFFHRNVECSAIDRREDLL